MKKVLLTFLLLIIPVKVYAEPLLYDVLKDYAETGNYAKEYTGEHQDTLDDSGTQKIYYWFPKTKDEVHTIDDKRNVLFANYCWEILRTTDSGGIKLIYDGIPVNGSCNKVKSTEPIERNTTYTHELSGQGYYFSDGYIFYETDNGFYLDDTKRFIRFPMEDPNELVGKYTYFTTNPNSSYRHIEKIVGYDSSTNTVTYKSLELGINASIGHSALTTDEEKESMGTVGYMHNKLYYPHINIKFNNWGSVSQSSTPISESEYNIIEDNTSTAYTFNTSTKKWSGSFTGSYSETTTYFTFKPNTAGEYILKINLGTTNNKIIIYKNDDIVMDLTTPTNTIVPLDNLTTDDVIKIEHVTAYGFDSTKTLPTFSLEIPTGTRTDTRVLVGNSVTYENGKYTLVDTMRSDMSTNIRNHHYTCFNTSGECEQVTYITTLYYDGRIYTFDLVDGQTIESIVNDMLYADDVNTIDSPAKAMIDTWFEENLIDYLPYLEDTVFCGDRSIYNMDINFLNPNGGTNRVFFTPDQYEVGWNSEIGLNNSDIIIASSLKCQHETDRFAVGNPKAQLKYPVALPSIAEEVIQTGKKESSDTSGIRGETFHYQLMTPQFYEGVHYDWVIQTNGNIYGMYGADSRDIRPVISLKPGTEYSSGDGSKDNPYVIREYHFYKALIENDTEKGIININVDDIENIQEDSTVTFTAESTEGYVLSSIKVIDSNGNEIDLIKTLAPNEYQFIMPRTDVTIIPVYEKIDTSTLVNPETRDYIMGIILISITSLGLLIILNKKRKDII